jgi:uncharacterized protein (TIGR02271 family)
MARKTRSETKQIHQSTVVTDEMGVTGTTYIPSDAQLLKEQEQIRVFLDSGGEVSVPTHLLEKRRLGHGYILKSAFSKIGTIDLKRENENIKTTDTAINSEQTTEEPVERAELEEALVVPVIEEELNLERQKRETGRVRINKVVHERTELIDEPLITEDVQVRRVPVNRVVDGPVPVRYEGDVMIIPLLEEVIVTEKRLILKEELHVTKQRTEMRNPQEVTLRTEEAIVEEVPSSQKLAKDLKTKRAAKG